MLRKTDFLLAVLLLGVAVFAVTSFAASEKPNVFNLSDSASYEITEELPLEQRNSAGAWLSRGNAFAEKAKAAEGREKKRFWKEAEDSYAKAADLDLYLAILWNNWALLLVSQAEAAEGKNQRDLWKKADKYYRNATGLDPFYAEAWHNWAKVLKHQSLVSKEEKDSLWEKSDVYNRKAINLDPALDRDRQ